ncbi:hypothetical protein DNK47_02620 [Mycoplasma wenyonii]|uniref:Type I restriction enzyme endonuclease subunit n=1 Tax=Mycoplasma wenyonii TaxID=65123 RepID=A0A328PKA5_9MOLU|nr:HsdR family type I site-specific deoxyribonuclease [Mycoplasma wenyonii]RAO94904.1 hypothetical protein DNK47_02620 [Mycoplasma wenyonii]
MEPENTKRKPITEEELEDYIISLFESQGYLYSRGNEIQRESYYEVFLLEDLTRFLKPKYPKLDHFDCYSDIRHIADDLQREDKQFYDFNKNFFKNLSDEITYIRERDGEKFSISLIDFKNPTNNIFRVVNQLAVEGSSPRRVDLVVYINGIPFVIWELKSPSDKYTDLRIAHQQLQLYQKEIPALFKYNAFTVLCDGIGNVRYGVSWETLESFAKWKKISDEESAEGKDLLSITIEGLFDKERIVKLIQDFIWFSDSNPQKKIICRYPQFYGALKMYDSIKKNLKPTGSGKGGIYFGTTGCGKSFTMLFLSRLLLKSNELNKPSVLLIADRVEISEQLCSLFQSSTDFLQDKNVKSINSRTELSESLKNLETGGVFITNIQKFEESEEPLSDRNNIICISDEAHRSQHNFDVEYKEGGKQKIPFGKRLHDSLPNATYVGFTATPIDKTMDVFGEIVDRYTMDESIDDGFTVKLKLEVRKGWLEIQDDIAQQVIEKYREARESGASGEAIEEDQKLRTQLKAICGVKERIEKIAGDIVNHYKNRVDNGETVCGKAMIVTHGRDIGYSIYKAIREKEPSWFEVDKETGLTKVQLVMTRTKGDEKEMYDLIGSDKYQKRLAEIFKENESNFKIAIVSDKWLTGFDCPCLDTMYLDRIFQDKQLIQTISRVNRKYMRKDYGLVVSYWPIQRYWKEALEKVGGGERGELSLEEVIANTKDCLELLNKAFYDFDRDTFLKITDRETQSEMVINYIEGKGEGFKADFKEQYTTFAKWYDLWANLEMSKELGEDRAFYKLVWSYWSRHFRKSWTPISAKTKQEISEHMKNIFLVEDMAQYSFGYLTVSFPSKEEYNNKKNSEEEKLRKGKKLGQAIAKIHKSFGKSFLERLARLQAEYEAIWKEQARLSEIEDPEERKRQTEESGIQERIEALNRERDELIEGGYRKMEEHKSKNWTKEEQVFFDQLQEFNSQFNFGLPEDQLLAFTRDINHLWQEIKSFGDPNTRFSVLSNLKMELYKLIDKHHFYENDDNYNETTIVILEELLDCFKRMTENER